jgi:integrase
MGCMASIRKRTWKSGGETKTAWICDYRDQSGTRRLKQFARKKDADAWLVKVRGEIAAGIHTPDAASITVSEAGGLWLDRCRTGGADDEPLETSTWQEYERHVRYICDSNTGIGHIKLSKLDRAMLTAFEQRLREAGKSAAMVRKVRTSLSSLISHAQDHGLVGRNVLREGRRKRRAKREKPDIAIPTKEELRALLAAATGSFRPFLVAAIFTGLRASELRGLTWSNVDLENGSIHVRQRADRWGKMGPPKSRAGNRDVPMSPMVRNTLREWKLACPNGPLGLVFPNRHGKVASLVNIVVREFRPLQVRCGIVTADGRPRYGWHALRHAAASLFIEQGFTPKKVQTLMGHSSIQMTYDTYGKLFPSPEEDLEAMAQVEARLIG